MNTSNVKSSLRKDMFCQLRYAVRQLIEISLLIKMYTDKKKYKARTSFHYNAAL